MWTFIIIAIVGFFAQYIDGALGMGYGASSASFLIAAGLLPALVSASVHTSEIFASLASGVSHLRFGNVETRIAIPLTCTGIIGGIIGAYFLATLSNELVSPFVAIILLILGARIFVRFLLKKHIALHTGEFSKRFLLFLGLIGGTVDAFGGGGWGPICTSTLVTANKREPRVIIGSVNIAEFFTTVAIVITFGFTVGFENFLWFITIPLIIGGILAAPVAAYTCKRVPPVLLGTLVGSILIVLNSRTLMTTLPALIDMELPVSRDLLIIPIIIALIFIITVIYYHQRKRTSHNKYDTSDQQ
ncbi:MAG: sulfite exporter TauE/SafE family protein [Candidatus Hodarchaeota archaeon]